MIRSGKLESKLMTWLMKWEVAMTNLQKLLDKFEEGDPVAYVPLFGSYKIEENNIGIVTSKNDQFIFVKYINQTNSQATAPNDLFKLDNRPDLKEKLGIKIYAVDKELTIGTKEEELYEDLKVQQATEKAKYQRELKLNVNSIKTDDEL